MQNNIVKKTADDFEKLLTRFTKKTGNIFSGLAQFVMDHKKLFISGFLLYLIASYFFSEEE